ncbi:MAG: iron-sulfur cluster assembly protein [Gammaproteobacteria bacterium]|jgi:iron-sulfur cluster assembly protein
MENTAIKLTDAAAVHVKNFLAKNSGGVGLRVSVKTTGCSGYQYVVNLAEDTNESDMVFQSQGITIVLDDKSLPFLEGTEMDYVREGLIEGFRFNNPKVENTCGCGESFSIKEDSPLQTGPSE